jgi:N-terminal domain of (some) glycogen debranching enzymes/Mannosylglycerate hydrolase MGH1-like glycoside hydrolase domain
VVPTGSEDRGRFTVPQPNQPFLHDLVCTLASPTQAWSRADGTIGRSGEAVGVQGLLHADVRVLSAAELLVDGRPTEHIATVEDGSSTRFTSIFRGAAWMSGGADEMFRVDRTRHLSPGRMAETITLESVVTTSASFELALQIAADLAPIEQIKTGTAGPAIILPEPAPEEPFRWGDANVTATLTAPGAALRLSEDRRVAQLVWSVAWPGQRTTYEWAVEIADRTAVVVPADRSGPGLERSVARLLENSPRAQAERQLRPWLDQSLADLEALRMASRDHPGEVFFAAGAPWYLTLFGRDSLWAARMLLPLDPAPAIGTLRTLARLAGTTVDPDSAQQPGKIPHELRRGTYAFNEISLPPLYYGTIDATPLWICLLAELWRSSGQDQVVADLLDPLAAALEWLVSYADADGDGFLEYLDSSGHGLANQGWKDSQDSVRFADGRIADGPVALCEVQGYAYEAALAGAEMLDAFGRHGSARYRTWAADLARRFREHFWSEDENGRYPALALDGEKQRVDSLTSNIGHLLGTGILDDAEERIVADRVTGPELDSGLGLRTLSAANGGYNPLSYHCGSVWPHDTAIVIEGLRRSGHRDLAGGLIEGLLRASVSFDQRLPELWSGEGAPVPYPTACRPQAWSAAAAVVVAEALTD